MGKGKTRRQGHGADRISRAAFFQWKYPPPGDKNRFSSRWFVHNFYFFIGVVYGILLT